MYLYLEKMSRMTMGQGTLPDCKYNLVKLREDHEIVENDAREPQVGGTIVFSIGGDGVYGRVIGRGLSGTTLGMTGSMVVKEVLMDSYEKNILTEDNITSSEDLVSFEII